MPSSSTYSAFGKPLREPASVLDRDDRVLGRRGGRERAPRCARPRSPRRRTRNRPARAPRSSRTARAARGARGEDLLEPLGVRLRPARRERVRHRPARELLVGQSQRGGERRGDRSGPPHAVRAARARPRQEPASGRRRAAPARSSAPRSRPSRAPTMSAGSSTCASASSASSAIERAGSSPTRSPVPRLSKAIAPGPRSGATSLQTQAPWPRPAIRSSGARSLSAGARRAWPSPGRRPRTSSRARSCRRGSRGRSAACT